MADEYSSQKSYKLKICIFFLILAYKRYCKILREKLYSSKICGFFLVKCYMTSRFQWQGLKEIKYNICVKHIQDTTAYVHLFRFLRRNDHSAQFNTILIKISHIVRISKGKYSRAPYTECRQISNTVFINVCYLIYEYFWIKIMII